MTKATLKSVVGLLIDNGLQPQIRALSNTEYAVRVTSDPGATVASVQTIATNQGVAAIVHDVEFQ